MKKYILLVVALFQILSANSIEELSVVVYPEYYYPGVMVEFTGIFNEVNEDKSFSFMVPAISDSVFQIKQVTETSTDMELLTPEDRNGEMWVTIPMTSKEFRVFAFYIPFNPHDENRTFDFSMKFEETMSNIHLAVNKPAASDNFVLDKTGYETFTDQHGLSFSRYHIKDLTPNTSYIINVSYDNPDGKTSIEYLKEMLASSGKQANPSGTMQSSTPPQRHHLPIWQPIVVLFAVFLVIGILFWKYRGNILPPQESKSQNAAYCSQCGTKLPENAKFCHSCGLKI